jgi:hypothetical protein
LAEDIADETGEVETRAVDEYRRGQLEENTAEEWAEIEAWAVEEYESAYLADDISDEQAETEAQADFGPGSRYGNDPAEPNHD